jgi:hypothetical protein
MTDEDRELFEAFQALRREEAGRVPVYSRGWRRNREPWRRSSSRLAAATVCLGMLIGVGVWLLSRTRTPQSGHQGQMAAASITTWKPETDFLLETPGRAVLYSVPRIGAWPVKAITSAGQRPRGPKKQAVR